MEQPPLIRTATTICVIHDGQPHNLDSTHPNWDMANEAIINSDWEQLVKCLDIKGAVREYTKGRYEITDGGAFYEGERIPGLLEERLIGMMREGSDFNFLLNFHKRLQANPSFRAVNELFEFLDRENIPIGPDGCFYAYKGVKDDLTDVWSGKFNNAPGTINEMPRNQVDDNRKQHCSHGFHVGSMEYATSWGPTVVIVKVDPADAVSVPEDCNCQKLRVCKYEVVSVYDKPLPSTTYDHRPAEVPNGYDLYVCVLDEEDEDDIDDDDYYSASVPSWKSQPRDAKGRFLPKK